MKIELSDVDKEEVRDFLTDLSNRINFTSADLDDMNLVLNKCNIKLEILTPLGESDYMIVDK